MRGSGRSSGRSRRRYRTRFKRPCRTPRRSSRVWSGCTDAIAKDDDRPTAAGRSLHEPRELDPAGFEGRTSDLRRRVRERSCRDRSPPHSAGTRPRARSDLLTLDAEGTATFPTRPARDERGPLRDVAPVVSSTYPGDLPRVGDTAPAVRSACAVTRRLRLPCPGSGRGARSRAGGV